MPQIFCTIHTQQSFKVATFREQNQIVDLPHPLSSIIFTYSTLQDPGHIIGLVQFHSIEAFDIEGRRIFYVQRLQALSHTHQVLIPVPAPRLSLPYPSMQNLGRGFNSQHGFDTGPPPPGTGFGFGQGGFPGFGGFNGGFPAMPMFTAPLYPPFGGFPGLGYPSPYGGQSHPSIPPWTDGGLPGINMRNPSGGVGIPPGYNYVFSPENTCIHVFKTPTPPWQMSVSAWDPATHVKLMVPCNTTVKELMQNLGCNNSEAKKNKMHEVQEAGGGRWVKGLSISGDDKDRCKKKICEMGWDKSRTGAVGGRPVVWLWCTKD